MQNQRKKKRIIFVSSAFVISLLALIFVISNFRDNIVFFYSPSEMQTIEVQGKIKNRQIRVGGLVKQGSVNKINAITTEFTITDLKHELVIYHKGMLPNLFREDQGMIAKGKFNKEQNKFFSHELLVKHDEKYMPPEIAESLKDSGYYKPE